MLQISDIQNRELAQNIRACLFLGGGKGGSKSYALCLLAVQHCEEFNSDAHALLIRRTFQGAQELKHDLMEIIAAKYEEDPRRYWNGESNTFTLKGGGRIEIGYLEREDDLLRYRGRGPTFLGLDEVADTDPRLINQLRTEIRGRKNVITRIVATANPARPFHSYWSSYATRTPWKPFVEDDTGLVWINCPSNILDNPFVDHDLAIKNMQKDPNAAALISGDWNLVTANAFFVNAYAQHRSMIEDWTHLPDYGFKFSIYCDHGGGSSPSAFLFCAIATEPVIDTNTKEFFPKNAIIVFDEYDDSHGRESGDWMSTYGLSIRENCDAIRKIAEQWQTPEGHTMLCRGRIDPQVMQDHGDPERLIDLYHQNGFAAEPWKKHSREGASAIVREMFHHAARPGAREKPGIYFTPRAVGCLATVPYLPTDKNRPNVPATKGVPDHHYDALKACAFERSLEWSITELQR